MKKFITISVPIVVVITMLYYGYKSYQISEAKKVFKRFKIHLPKSSVFEWINEKPKVDTLSTIILYFHPECDHCEYEAKIIIKKQKEFANVNVWWVSFADTSSIRKFGKMYGVDSLQNSYLAHISAQKVTQTFGSISVPHIFIYDKHQVLQKEYKGETKIEAILKYL